MTFQTIIDETGSYYFVDGFEVPQAVYDAFRPSKMFPTATMPMEDALKELARIKATTKRAERKAAPYFALAIDSAHPIKSDALAVHPKQIKQVLARNKKHGLSIPYDRHGRPVLTDPNMRRKLMKLEKVRDLNSPYGY